MDIGNCLVFNGRTKVVWVGFSFMMRNSRTQDMAYIYAARELSLIRSKPRNKVQKKFYADFNYFLGNVE